MYRLLRPLLFLLPAETAHELTLDLLRWAQPVAAPLLRRLLPPAPLGLQQDLWGLRFPGPVGLAAGLDKNAELVPLFRALGCGLVEVGSVTAQPAPGNPRPRVFRLPRDQALINRMGLPNHGAEAIAAALRRAAPEDDQGRRAPLGINLAKTHDPALVGDAAIADFCLSYQALAPLADYLVLNISCPNTSDGRTFEEPDSLAALLSALPHARAHARARSTGGNTSGPPLLLKLAPPPGDAVAEDKSEGRGAPLRPLHPATQRLDELLRVARAHGVDGFVLGNTTPERPTALRTPAALLQEVGRGGLSGPPLAPRQLALTRHVFRQTRQQGWAAPLIGVGGIDSVRAAYQRICAGAALLQVYTALIYQGPGLISRLHRGLAQALDRGGHATLSDAIGSQA